MAEIDERTGSRRAGSLAHTIRAATAYLAGDETYAINEGELAIAVANEPVYLEFGRTILLHVQAGFARVDEAITTAEQCRQFVAQNRTEVFGAAKAPADALVCLLMGDLGTGMTLLERSTSLGGLFGMLSDVYRAVTYARMATRESGAPLGALARNPVFVVRHGLTARRRAQRLLTGAVDLGGRTDLDNLILLLCQWHHTAVHEGGVRITRESDRWVFTKPDGQPCDWWVDDDNLHACVQVVTIKSPSRQCKINKQRSSKNDAGLDHGGWAPSPANQSLRYLLAVRG